MFSDARKTAKAELKVELMHGRHTFEVRRQPDGSWKTVKLEIELQDIWRGLGFFTGGQGPGL
jgi:hypothetical protein